MGEIIGQVFGVNPTQAFRDALYDQIFDQHEDVEVDVIVVLRHLNDNPDESGDVEVVDFQVTRVDEDYMDGFEPFRDEEYDRREYTSYLEKVSAWGLAQARDVPDRKGSYILIHKHPEGTPDFASDKDRWGSMALTSFDYAASTDEDWVFHPDKVDHVFHRHFLGMFVMHRNIQDIVQEDPRPLVWRSTDIPNHINMSGAVRKITAPTLGEARMAEFDAVSQEMLDTLNEFFDVSDERGEDVARAEVGPKLASLGPKISKIGVALEAEAREKLGLEPVDRSELFGVVEAGSLQEALEQILAELENGPLGQLIQRTTKPSDDDQFPILGRPAQSAPRESIAAEPNTPADDDARPDVPDIFDDIDIQWVD